MSANTPIAAVSTSSPVIGRASTIVTLARTLSERRLLTLTGPGGIGKTTVALGVMEAVAAHYPQGAYFVDLAAVVDTPLVPCALASSLRVASLTDPLAAALAFLRERAALLVLDNCEHLIDAVARLTQTLLAAAPGVRILATSREPLDVAGERVHRLAPLDLPPEGGSQSGAQLLTYSAVRLFVERARASAGIEFDDESLARVAELCRGLEGHPLAIEITAARVELLGLKGLAANLLQGLHLSLGGSRVAAARHRTLRKTLDWSYELLSPREQVTFRRLAVFSGAFDLQAATVVVAAEGQSPVAVFESLFQLAAKSLIVTDATGETTLYRLPDTPRAYALEKLRECGEIAAEGAPVRMMHEQHDSISHSTQNRNHTLE